MYRRSASVLAAGGLLVVLLVGLVVSVLWVSDDAKHPLRQPVSSPPSATAPAPTATTAAVPPAPSTVAEEPAPFDASQVTAEMITPPPTAPRRWRLHELFPQLFPSG